MRDAFTRSSEALAVVDEARREATAPRFVEAGPRRRRYEGEEEYGLPHLSALKPSPWVVLLRQSEEATRNEI